MTNIIPVMHCFDNNYVIPASVSFYSMLKHADKSFIYNLYVLHTDITVENQEKLKQTIACFNNASLEFIDMGNKFADLFANTATKAHYSKEMYYKFLAPSIFEQYYKIIITDVDVVFLDDISKEFLQFNTDDYFGAFNSFILKNSFLEQYRKGYVVDFNKVEQKATQYGAGYYIFNLHKMREDNIEQKCIEFIKQNSYRVKQPEQDTLNIVCYPKIKKLSPQSVVCTYMYDLYKTEDDFNNDLNWSAEDIKFAMQNPVQLHYATHIKPWKNPSCTKSEIWFAYLLKTPFFTEQMQKFEKKDVTSQQQWYYVCKKLPIVKIKNKKAYLFGFIRIGRLK